ncbi:lipid A core-O-antigen ligase-like enyme [Mizugakiibacter sediminis]|uniref:Lipid A core-O-antigen ligase-like enyme n=1 Tax=Mizugakiibacter sediminis TaxID=1475481 RepID=A0A0K8QSI0_9GAMM|nr:O-antigen ligase family protein [Mizugakiibacter sediminis]GAP67342.1 lipid A core-O-antigen ligase-like enyme [Mizugakiibacter sediminis]
MPLASRLRAALRSPLTPLWAVLALLPFGRSAEAAVLVCMLGTVLLFVRHPRALGEHAGARLLLWLWGAYVAAALLSTLDAVAPAKSWTSTAGYLRFAPFGLYACYAMRYEARLRALCFAVAALLAFWMLDAWLQALTGWSLGGRAEAQRISGIFGAGNLKLGPTLAVLSPFALWAARERWGRTGLVAAFLLLLGPVLLSGSRASWLSYALVALAFAWRETRAPLRFAAWCGATLAVGALAAGLAWRTSPRFEARIERTLLALKGDEAAVDAALAGRLDIWRASLRMIAAHPLNGVGVRGFRYAYPQYAPAGDHFLTAEACGAGEGACHAHQLLLEVLTETGGVGLLLWLAAAAAALAAWRRASPAARERAWPASVALAVAVFPFNTHLAFYSAWWGLLFWWLVAVWCAALYVFPGAALAASARGGRA